MSSNIVSAPIFYKRFSLSDAAPTASPVLDASKSDAPQPSSTRPVPVLVPSTSQNLVKRKREVKNVEECDEERERHCKAKKDEFDEHRKVKKDERDEHRAELISTRADLDVKRKHWLYANRELFEPLLPSHQNGFFPKLIEEMANGATPPLPMQNFVVQPELIVGGEMKEYQLAGLSFLAHMYHNGINCILGDEMGLGKTLQTLSLFAYIKESATTALTHLIVCPLSVLSSWETECARWTPSMRAVRFHGTPAERERIKGAVRADSKVDIVLTTYETLSSSDMGWLKTRRFACVVLDEGHRIKNADTDVASRVAGLGGMWRIILTGTPIQNNLTELWGLLHWLYPQIFTPTTRTLFAQSFDLQNGTYALPIINAVRTLLGTIQLRRTKATLTESGALGGVPPRVEWTVFIPLTEAQRFWTYRMLTRLETVDLEAIFPRAKEEDGKLDDGRREVLTLLENHAKGGPTTTKQWQKFSMLLMQLRRICDHPYMIDDAEPQDYEIGEHVVAASSKLMAIDKILADVLPKGERVLIFSQWTDMLDLLEDFMVLRGIAYLRLDGSVSRARRSMVIRMFQRDDSQHKVFLISTKAGGLGINLTKASTVIMCDSDWNPQNDLQAIARAHRIGQTKVVNVYRLICAASVEDQMLDRTRRKLFLSAKIIGGEAGGQNGDAHGGLGGSELMSILRRGSSALTHSDDGMTLVRFRTASLQEILEVSRAREDVHDARVKHELNIETGAQDESALLRSAEEEERELLSGVARVQSYLFEGTLLERSKAPIQAAESATPQKRGRVDRVVNIGGMSFILDESMVESITKEKAPPKKVKKSLFEWEDYCINCRDGGEVAICSHCPRVFHAECHSTLSAAEVNRRQLITCSQHQCCRCSRGTGEAGGLLLRCQTCPQAFCSDCVPWDDITMVGDTIPEFVLRKYGKKDSAYYIRCADCLEQGRKDSQWLKSWEAEIAEAQKLVDSL
ncbi:P-loop containing nucleoside triphosphate hydrolase protein [Mycena maculata]|uniref:P-loop containing nucleoside triphosphate hydrolase protein n=1 Tax=Mycena maculata TaxID=230809 RepID=A0AAD7NIE1_9AGAR|nr:P-loop containing nucleoside triphosphate hydrolase protein [Mycena maculata]